MPFLAGFIAAAGAAVGSATAGMFTWAGVAKIVVNLLINIGLALLQMALQRPIRPEDIQSVIKQSVPVRFVHLGRVRTGGPMVFIEVTSRTLYQIIYFGEGPMEAVEEQFIDNRSILKDADGWVTSYPYGSGDKDNKQRVQIIDRLGANKSTAYEELIAAFPGVVTRRWRGDGLVTSMISAVSVDPEFVYTHYPNRLPQLNVIGRFGSCYDPRTETRRWTDSMPLMLLEYLTHKDGAAIPISLFDLSDFIHATRIAAQILTTKNGGTVRRYHGSLSWSMDEAPRDVLARALLAMDGRLTLKPNGKIGFVVGEWIEPTVHIPDNAILDAEIRDASSPISEANEVVVRYTNVEANFSQATCDPWRNEAAYNRAGGKFRNTTVELYGIQNHNHARRIAKIIDRKTNAKWQGTIRTTLAGMDAWDQRFITITYSDLGIDAESFEVLGISVDEEEMSLTIQIASASAEMYAFNSQTEEGTPPIDPVTLGPDAIPAPQDLTVEFTAETVHGVRDIDMTISVDKPKRKSGDSKVANDVKAEFQYARADSNRWVLITVGKEFTTTVERIKQNAKYDVRVRFHTAQAMPGDWVMLENQKAIDPVKPSKPGAKRGIVRNDGGISVKFIAPSESFTDAIEFFWNSTDKFKGSKLIGTVSCAPNEEVSYVHSAPRKGTNYYFACAINGSGVRSEVAKTLNNPVRY
jgi:hypothetical protein